MLFTGYILSHQSGGRTAPERCSEPLACLHLSPPPSPQYRPPNGDATSFAETLTSLVSRIENRHKFEILLMGDMNIDVNLENDVTELLLSHLKAFAFKTALFKPHEIW